MPTIHLLLLLIFAATAVGCQSGPQPDPISPSPGTNTPTFDEPDRPVAYLDGQPLRQHELFSVLAEMDGGLALSEVLIDRRLAQRLDQQGLTLTPADIDYEKQLILDTLSEDEDQAVRLLRAMRERRGLGELRYTALLRRNAGLRKLVRNDISVGEAAIRQAYQLAYGPRYTVRLILCDTAQAAQRIRQHALGGASFIDLAVQQSTDPSAAQGGLLSPISPADATYPAALRDVLPTLATQDEAQRISPVLTLGQSYAVVRLEEVTPANGPGIDAVRNELTQQVRLRLERLRMQQLAQTLIEGADLIVLDPTLKESWRRQRGSIEDAASPR
ncbi:MAG: peptidylprolyl isomerase [Planctomycetota bacterium]